VVSTVLWIDDYQHELGHALEARSIGNEGMARVCARRAAGIVVGEYLLRRGYTNLSHSVYERITIFSNLPDIDPELKTIAGHFLVKVNKNHQIPEDIDLISDAQRLKKDMIRDLDH
jgi:hypothetical protein